MGMWLDEFTRKSMEICKCLHERREHFGEGTCHKCQCNGFRLTDEVVAAIVDATKERKKSLDEDSSRKCSGCHHSRASHSAVKPYSHCYVGTCGCSEFKEPKPMPICTCGHEGKTHSAGGSCLDTMCRCIEYKKQFSFCSCGHEETEHWNGELQCTMPKCACASFDFVDINNTSKIVGKIGKSEPVKWCGCGHRQRHHKAGVCIMESCKCKKFSEAITVEALVSSYAAIILRISSIYGCRYVYGIPDNDKLERPMYLVGTDTVRIRGWYSAQLNFSSQVNTSFTEGIDNLMNKVLSLVRKAEDLALDINQITAAIAKKEENA